MQKSKCQLACKRSEIVGNSKFKIVTRDNKTNARACKLKTAHGIIETPVFMPVATQAVLKGGVDAIDAQSIKAPIILANTYHLYLRGAVPIIKKAGGLHQFMGWHKPILTDSGGFQVWSLGSRLSLRGVPRNSGRRSNLVRDSRDCFALLAMTQKKNLVKIDHNGVSFFSHLDGTKHRLTPEIAVKIQQDLAADIIMAFDEATPDSSSYLYTKEAMERTHNWAERCIVAKSKIKNQKNPSSTPKCNSKIKIDNEQLLFGIIQGGRFKRLRQKSAEVISSMEFDGIAIGGESIGYNMARTAQILEYLMPILPQNKPIYTMGVGFSPLDFFTVVERGIDMFDCVAPARIARHGTLYSREAGHKSNYRINIFNAKFKQDFHPVCDWCDCVICKNYSRAYLRHLFKSEELTALRLSTIHNLRFMLHVMEEIREAIKKDTFEEVKRKWFGK